MTIQNPLLFIMKILVLLAGQSRLSTPTVIYELLNMLSVASHCVEIKKKAVHVYLQLIADKLHSDYVPRKYKSTLSYFYVFRHIFRGAQCEFNLTDMHFRLLQEREGKFADFDVH